MAELAVLQQGITWQAISYYPGPSQAGAVERHSINDQYGNVIQELHFPVTPASRSNHVVRQISGHTPPRKRFGNRPVLDNLNFVDANSFVATTTYVYAVGEDSTCTTVFQNTYLRTGDLPH